MSLKSKIQALITAANAKTGETDATLTDAVQTLVDGYGGGITPTGNINITDTNVTDVTNYATATVVDADLVASNIKKDVNILGVVGSFEGGGGETYPDISDAPIPEGYNICLYAVIDNRDENSVKSADLYFAGGDNAHTVERGRLVNGEWLTDWTVTETGTTHLDWSERQSDFIIFRAYCNALGSARKWFSYAHNVIAEKVYLANSTDANYASDWLFFPVSLKKIICAGVFSFINGTTKIFPQQVEIIDGSRCTAFTDAPFRFLYQTYNELASLKSQIFPNARCVVNYANVRGWANCESIESLDLSMFDITGATNMGNCWDKCVNLRSLNISGWNMSTVTTTTSMFSRCMHLKDVVCAGAIFPAVNFSMSDSSLLTDASLVNIANALPNASKTLTLHATPKARLSVIVGTVADGVFTADESGSTTLLSFINNTKGWTVA